MRATQYLIATLKETPADAEVISHQLLLRAGLIRKLASGLYTWLPMGLRVMRKVEKIVREEMDRSGALEVLMPAVQPAELWEESGRWSFYGDELLRIKDRHQRDFCVGPTHEEVITDIARNELKSYKQLPVNFYQIQTKFRDERRPRFGIMRAREFLMKDAYSFHVGQDSLDTTYDVMYDTYTRIFTRLQLDFRAVQADSGSIGGNSSHEFHVLADSGEDDIAFSTLSQYAANIEMAEALTLPQPAEEPADLLKIATPNQKTIEEVAGFLKVPAEKTVKTLLVRGVDEDGNPGAPIALVLRGDHNLNEVKAEKIQGVAKPLQFATDAEVAAAVGANPGSIGPANLSVRTVVDRSAAALHNFVAGANEDGFHYTNLNWGRDCQALEVADLREVVEGDPSPDGHGTLTIRRGIEVGHVFKLGKKYSHALNATVLDENGKAVVMDMGCYGIGVSRVVAAAIEQNHDDKGIIWPTAIAPFQVVLVPLNMHKSEEVAQVAENMYQTLQDAGIEVLLDDRNERPGVKFADMELIGIPHRVVISERGLAQGQVEYRARAEDANQDVATGDIIGLLKSRLEA